MVKSRGQAAAAAAAAAKPSSASASKSESSSESSQSDNEDVDTRGLSTLTNASSSTLATGATNALMQSASLALPSSSVMQQHKQAGVGGLPTTVTPPTGIARFSTMGPHGPLPPSLVTAPSSFTRQLSRLPSTIGGNFMSADWRANVAVEERISIRRKLREAYFKHCPTYEQLLDTVVAVDEELLFSCSNNRIDYFKSSIDWDSRIQLKRQQLKQNVNATAAAAAVASPPGPTASNGMSKKRSLGDENLSGNSVSLLELGINNADLLPPVSSTPASALQIPSISQLTGSIPKSPSKDTASSLVALSKESSTTQPNKKQKN